jgi:Family of unknown function (DUF6353)
MNLVHGVTRTVSRQILIFKKQSPNIFFVGGIAGIVTSTILACRATLKLNETLDVIQSDLKGVTKLKDSDSENYPIEEYHKDVMYAYIRAGVQLGKLYGAPIVIGSASIAMLTGSHVQLTRRNSALMAAYAAVQKAYDDYRDRVREELGPEKELDIYHAASTEIVKSADGKEEVKTADPNRWSPYARFFDEASRHWEKDPELNRLYIQCQQNYANNLLHSRGHVFLNEVYDMLDIDRCKAGAVVGWVVGKDGDNYVDFGIYRAFSSRFVNGREANILLDFNVDGVIYDKI